MAVYHTLTPRETQVVYLVACGSDYKSIAALLGISIITVRHHIESAVAKYQANNRTHLIALWLVDSWGGH